MLPTKSYSLIGSHLKMGFVYSQKRTVNSKKYGVDLVHFTHAKNTAIHASTKVDGKPITISSFF